MLSPEESTLLVNGMERRSKDALTFEPRCFRRVIIYALLTCSYTFDNLFSIAIQPHRGRTAAHD